MTLIAAFAVALLISTLMVPVLMRYAGVLGLMDLPTEARKVHVKLSLAVAVLPLHWVYSWPLSGGSIFQGLC